MDVSLLSIDYSNKNRSPKLEFSGIDEQDYKQDYLRFYNAINNLRH